MTEMGELSARKVRTIKADGKSRRYADGDNLYLHVSKSGAKSWVFMWKDKAAAEAAGRKSSVYEIGLGALSRVSLKVAREKAAEYRRQLGAGINPRNERVRQEAQRVEAVAKSVTFEQYAKKYISDHEAGWRNPKHRQQWSNTLAAYVYPVFGSKAVSEVATDDVVEALKPIWRDKAETAGRVRGRIETILNAAKAEKLRSGENPAVLRGHLDLILGKLNKKTEHHPALRYEDAPAFFAQLRGRDAMGALALQFAILTAARSSEVRLATWREIDFESNVWAVPADRMKGEREHRVPLCSQAIAVLRKVEPLKSDLDSLIFPGAKAARPRKVRREGPPPLSDMTLGAVIKRMHAAERKAGRNGWVDGTGRVATQHGFRSTFRDWSGDETEYAREVAEAALAHKVGDKAEQAYRRGSAFKKRQAQMLEWEKYVASL
jgi:integrase